MSKKKWILENILSLLIAVVLILGLRSSVIEMFKIPSGSMIPSLYVGDHILVSKFAYGWKLPFSDLIGSHPIFLTQQTLPKRGDIVVFKYPKDPSLYYIKRVIGLPGELIEVQGNRVWINGQMISQKKVNSELENSILLDLDVKQFETSQTDVLGEVLDTKHTVILHDRRQVSATHFGPEKIPTNSLFVMGDNRDFSNDSRYWGYVPLHHIKGKAIMIWLSLWMDYTSHRYSFRPERIGLKLN